MIISPTKDNILTLIPNSDYTAFLPDVRINLEASKVITTEKNISGTSSISIWNENISGEKRELLLNLPEEIYVTLKRMKESGYNEWLLRAYGRIFVIAFDLISAVPDDTFSRRWSCSINIVFLYEEKV